MTVRWQTETDLVTWWAIMRWRLAEDTGWTLEYIDNLSFGDIRQWLSIKDAEANMRD